MDFIKDIVYQLTRWPLLATLCLSIAVVLLPPGSFTVIPGTEWLLRTIVDTVPGIGRYVAASRFPETAAVYFPLMFLLSPLLFAWIWQLGLAKTAAEFKSAPLKASVQSCVVLGLTVLIGWATFFVGGGQLETVPWNESKIALALAGYLASGGAFFVGAAALALYARSLIRARRSAEE